jgi:RNA polymerase sigma-70 factor (ECF subfamily)
MSDSVLFDSACDDRELMARAANGSAEAFAELVRRHQHGLANFFRRLGVYTDAEDLVQETFVRIFKYRRRYRPASRFTTFLYFVARNAWRDHVRRMTRRDRLAQGLTREAEVAAQSSPQPDAAGRGRLDLETALLGLSPKLREVVVLNGIQGLSYQEVAEVLRIPLGTVKSRINLALHRLQEALDE